jgi:hypothetical protein
MRISELTVLSEAAVWPMARAKARNILRKNCSIIEVEVNAGQTFYQL